MIIHKTFQYRLNPKSEQEQALAVQFGHARFIWNWALTQRETAYKETGKGIGYYELKRQVTVLKSQAETKWLKEADSQVLQAKIQDLERAYKNFFEKRSQVPRFKSKRDGQSIRYPQRFKFYENCTYLPKVGWVKTKFHRPLEGRPKNVTVSKTKTGKYFVSIQCEIEMVDPATRGGEIGIDLGIKYFLATSEGWKRDNPRHLQRAERKLPAARTAIQEAAEQLGLETMLLISRAGHDAQALASLCSVGMIFVPSVGGTSHSPDEFTLWQDCVNGANLLLQTVLRMAA